MIYRTGTQQQAAHDLAIVNLVAADYWNAQGYAVIDIPDGKAVIGKNAGTGDDNPAGLTTTWAVIEELPDGRFGFVDPVNDARFRRWKDHIPQGISLQCSEEQFTPLDPA